MPGLSYLAQCGPPVPTSWICTLPPVTHVPHYGLVSVTSTPTSQKSISKIKMRSFRDSPHRVCVAFLHIYKQHICCQKRSKNRPNLYSAVLHVQHFISLSVFLQYEWCLIQIMCEWVKMSSVKCIFIYKFATFYRSVCGARLQIWLQLLTNQIAAPDYRSDCNFLQIWLRHPSVSPLRHANSPHNHCCYHHNSNNWNMNIVDSLLTLRLKEAFEAKAGDSRLNI